MPKAYSANPQRTTGETNGWLVRDAKTFRKLPASYRRPRSLAATILNARIYQDRYRKKRAERLNNTRFLRPRHLPSSAQTAPGSSRTALSILYAALTARSFNLRLDCISREPARAHGFRSALHFFAGWSVGNSLGNLPRS
jgi:hypothetical protein